VEKAFEVLMGEHRLIERALGALESCGVGVRAGESPRREILADFAAFFTGFADACHHGKEEDILFRRMMERGFPRDVGPLAVMLDEHERGRAHVRALSALASGSGGLAPGDRDSLLGHVDEFVPLLRAHIQKEDRVLYPMAVQLLRGPELDAMNSEFEAFEARIEHGGGLDRLRRLADDLVERFPPDPLRMAECAVVGACVGVDGPR
jgi:hemerythrin-like domain-containing protein